MSYSIGAIRRAFCIFFTSIAIGVGTSASLNELAFQYNAPTYIYPVIWIPIMAGTILGFKLKHHGIFKAMGQRFTQSVKWSSGMKAITGICWALPFTLIPLFSDYYSYLILLGIGLGNTSTYLITRKVNGTSFTEQMIVGLVSLAALPIIIFIGLSHSVSNDTLQFLARLSIAVAYGAGGSYIFQLGNQFYRMTKKEFGKRTEEDWKKQLTPEQYEVCMKKGTETPFSGEYWNCKEKGIYQCVCCGQELFHSDTKYDSGTGWPSFWAPVKQENVKHEKDYNYGMIRVEVLCSKCDAHLGHVFDDGPEPTNKRYCINSAALKLVKKNE